MPDGFLTIIGFLSLGYLLFAVELIVPGGILGILGIVSVIYGCYLSFDLGFVWGTSSIAGSVAFFVVAVRLVLRSKAGKAMMLGEEAEAGDWKSTDESLNDLLGCEGEAVTPLRPSGVALFADRRIDVVSDGEFLNAGTRVTVVEVEGRRVEVEAIDSESVDLESTAPESIDPEAAETEMNGPADTGTEASEASIVTDSDDPGREQATASAHDPETSAPSP